VICNLHTIDTARAYCDRIIGMRMGQIVFDGLPGALNREKIQEIYGSDLGGDEFDENVTSTAMPLSEALPIDLRVSAAT
jgi:phosphonate transport system ATP-binding protein